MLVQKLCTTRRLRRTQAPTFIRYMNRAPARYSASRHRDRALQGNHRSLGPCVGACTRLGARKSSCARGRGLVRFLKNLNDLQQLFTLKPSSVRCWSFAFNAGLSDQLRPY